MLRTLLATTALTSILTVGAFAQDQAPETDTSGSEAVEQTGATASGGVTLEAGYTFEDSDHLSSEIVGRGLYNGPAADAEQIGDINDLILNEDGNVIGVVVGVGGFLGIGQKQVAVGYDQLEWVTVEQPAPADPAVSGETGMEPATPESTPAEPGTEPLPTDSAPVAEPEPERRLMLNATREQLEAAPEFSWDEQAVVAPAEETAPVEGEATMEADPAAEGEAAMDAVPVEGEATMEADPADEGAMTVESEPAAEGDAAATAEDQTSDTEMAAEGDASAQVNTDSMTQVDATGLSAEDLLGTRVLGMNDEDVGEIEDIALNADGGVDAIVIGVGGFLGIGEKQVAVAMDNLRFTVDEAGTQYVWINLTQEELEQQPAYNPDEFNPDNALTSAPY